MATRLFSDDQLEQLRSFPDIGKDELVRFFTLTPADVAFVAPGRGRGPSDRLGLAVQLCTLSWLGFVPDEVTAAPPVTVARLAERLQVDPAVLAGYGEREQTRTGHLRARPAHGSAARRGSAPQGLACGWPAGRRRRGERVTWPADRRGPMGGVPRRAAGAVDRVG